MDLKKMNADRRWSWTNEVLPGRRDEGGEANRAANIREANRRRAVTSHVAPPPAATRTAKPFLHAMVFSGDTGQDESKRGPVGDAGAQGRHGCGRVVVLHQRLATPHAGVVDLLHQGRERQENDFQVEPQ